MGNKYIFFLIAAEVYNAKSMDRNSFITAWKYEQENLGIKPKVLNESRTAWVEAS